MKIHLFPVALFALLVVGCNEEPEPIAPIDDNTDLACQVLSISSDFQYEDDYSSSEGSTTVTLSYNSDKTVDKLTSNFSEYYCYMNNDIEECETYESNEEYVFTYSNGLITDVSIIEEEEEAQEIVEFTYANNKISKVKFYEDDDADFDEFIFVYRNDGKLEKLENWDNYSGPTSSLVLYGYDAFEWTGNNVTSISSYYDEFEEGRSVMLQSKSIFGVRELKKVNAKSHAQRVVPELSSKLTITYDDKNNPLFGNLPFLLWDGEFYSYLSANNPKTITETEFEDGGQQIDDSETYTYSYNDQGFPTVVTNDGDETTITYQCE